MSAFILQKFSTETANKMLYVWEILKYQSEGGKKNNLIKTLTFYISIFKHTLTIKSYKDWTTSLSFFSIVIFIFRH
jgi:hypothetical protein